MVEKYYFFFLTLSHGTVQKCALSQYAPGPGVNLLADFRGKKYPMCIEEECGGKVSLWFRVWTKSIFVPVVKKDVET